MNRSSHQIRPSRVNSQKQNQTGAVLRKSCSRQKRPNVLSSRSQNIINTSPAKNQIKIIERKSSSAGLGFSCQNHKGKEARYRIISQDEDTLFYCEKCSIFLASQGFAVQKLSLDGTVLGDGSNQMSSDMSELHNHIEHVLKNLEEKEQAIKQKISDAEHYKQEIQINLDVYFKKICDFIAEKKKEFKKFVENEHRKLLQGYQQSEVEIQKAILEAFDIKEQITDRMLDPAEISYYKTCIKKSRIMCEKLDVLKAESRKDIVTIDISQIIRIMEQNMKIKVKVAGEDQEDSIDEQTVQQQSVSIEQLHLSKLQQQSSGKTCMKKPSMGESQIRRINQHYNSLFSNEGNS